MFASKCLGECHACTAALCDLGDPGGGDPWFPHGAFVASITQRGPLDCFCLVLCCVLFWTILRMTHKMSSCMQFPLLVAIPSLSFLAGFCFGCVFWFVCSFLVCFVFDGIAHWTLYWSTTSSFEAADQFDGLASKLQFSFSAAVERV